MSSIKIWVASVVHKHGTNHYAALTQVGIHALVADYCREWWEKDDPEESIEGKTDLEIISAYFDWNAEIGSVESGEIAEVPLALSEDAANEA